MTDYKELNSKVEQIVKQILKLKLLKECGEFTTADENEYYYLLEEYFLSSIQGEMIWNAPIRLERKGTVHDGERNEVIDKSNV